MTEKLTQQVAAMARQVELLTQQLAALDIRVDSLDISFRTKRFRFSETVALVVTTTVGVIMAIYVISIWINLWIN